MIVKLPLNANYDVTKHKFEIISLNDAQAACSCGWSFCATGPRTKEALIFNHNLTRRKFSGIKGGK